MVEDEIVDLFNDVFDLDLDWAFSDEPVSLSVGTLEEFNRLCVEISHKLQVSNIEAAVWFLSRSRRYIAREISEDDFFRPLGLTRKQKEELSELISSDQFRSAANVLKNFVSRRYHLARIFSSPEPHRVFELFLGEENNILRGCGFNQKSVTIIIDRIKAHEKQIISNCKKDKTVPRSEIARALKRLRSLSVPSHFYEGPTWTGRTQITKQGSGPGFFRAKDKVVGLATMWGDCLPLLLAKDWGIAGVFSAVAGATVAAILPRGDRRPWE